MLLSENLRNVGDRNSGSRVIAANRRHAEEFSRKREAPHSYTYWLFSCGTANKPHKPALTMKCHMNRSVSAH